MDPVEIKKGRALFFLNPRLAEDEDWDPTLKFHERERRANIEKEAMKRDYARLRKTVRDRGFILGFVGSQEEEEARWEEIRDDTTNLTRARILEKLKALSEDEDSDCILVAVIGHGGRRESDDGHSRELFRVKGGEHMYVEDIWDEPFLNYEKPKIFLFKACRGREHDEGIDWDGGRGGSDSDIPELKKDFLIFRSTTAGYITPVHEEQLIQNFCDVLDEKDSPDLTALMTEANGRAAKAAYTWWEPLDSLNPSIQMVEKKYKQMPEIQSTMTKPIWLKPKPENLKAVLEPTGLIIPENGKALIYTCGNNEGVNGDLENILYGLGFDVEAKDISGLTRAAVLEDMETLSENQGADCVLVAMTVKGGRETIDHYGWHLFKDVIHVQGDTDLSMEEIFKPFKGKQALAGKPKIFFICQEDGERKEREDYDRRAGGDDLHKLPTEADFLIYQLRSARPRKEGSLLIQSICQVLNNAERDDKGIFKQDLMSLLTQVNKQVSGSEDKQIPEIVSRLTKPVHYKKRQK